MKINPGRDSQPSASLCVKTYITIYIGKFTAFNMVTPNGF
ncbi:hypothetical protein ETAE_0056 [Edwardsiella piscicida]|uniref:Uncharacterized protein n=1 Tax=Edwardsiella piscicida TaxID=1263550 RepID=A0AAU8P504_EDWPI|nr:hypothetical protein ETAE_0056 [Edwardsiella tarda EIB202]